MAETVNLKYVTDRLQMINEDSKNRAKALKEFLEECEHNLAIDADKEQVIDHMADAEIVVVTGDYYIGGVKQPQETLARLPFMCGYSFSMYNDPVEDEDLSGFVKTVLTTASCIRSCYETYPDVPVSVQVRFNFTHVNV
tara:strand:- start:990 stop:1406 length:417 start_codon:yes stop_codon:yes gene_type:complete